VFNHRAFKRQGPPGAVALGLGVEMREPAWTVHCHDVAAVVDFTGRARRHAPVIASIQNFNHRSIAFNPWCVTAN
jgi:hypothetical protein